MVATVNEFNLAVSGLRAPVVHDGVREAPKLLEQLQLRKLASIL